MAGGFQGKEGQKVPEMTPEVVSGITDRYIELYNKLSDKPFERTECENVAARIEKNILDFLKTC